MITRMSRLPWLRPRYAISTGNQVDLTIGDYVRHLAGDPAVRTFAVYVEGFRDADGLAFARAVEEVVAGGRDVVFYKAGRTAEGRRATSGHTASLAGDYDVCEAVVGQAGALVARTFDEFLGLLRVSVLAGSRNWRGRRLAAMSNAGYEAVGIADGLRGDGWNLELASLGSGTRLSLQAALAGAGADSLVDVRNPIDLTPMADDGAHEQVLRALLADPGVDLVLCSTVPLTAATATLPDQIASEGSLPNRLARVLREHGQADRGLDRRRAALRPDGGRGRAGRRTRLPIGGRRAGGDGPARGAAAAHGGLGRRRRQHARVIRPGDRPATRSHGAG